MKLFKALIGTMIASVLAGVIATSPLPAQVRSALPPFGTTSGTVAAGNDSRFNALLSPTQFSRNQIAAGQNNIFIEGGATAFSLLLPSGVTDGYRQSITFDAALIGGRTSVALVPPAGQSISDSVTSNVAQLVIQGRAPVTLTYSASTGTWTLGNGSMPVQSFSADFLNDVYSYGYQANPSASSLAALWTLTRAAPGATYVDSTGMIQDAAANTWRKTYDIGTKTMLGYLVEESRFNYIVNSVPLTDVFSRTPPSGMTVAASTDIPAIYNNSSAKVAKVSVSSAQTAALAYAITNGVTVGNYASSVWVWIPRSYSGGLIVLGNEVSSATGTNVQVAVDLTKRDQWQRVWAPISITTAGNVNQTLRMTGVAGDYIYLTAPQLENGPAPTSYIPTNGGGVTRAADLVTPASNIGLDVSQGGALSLDAVATASPVALPTGGVEVADAPTGTNAVALRAMGDPITPVLDLLIHSASKVTGRVIGAPIVDGTPFKLTGVFGDGDFSLSDSAGGVSTLSNVSQPPTLSRVFLGTPYASGSPTTLTAKSQGAMIYRGITFIPGRLSPLVAASIAETRGPFAAQANASSPGLTIPVNFIGSSFEANSYVPLGTNTSLVNLYKALGPNGVIRIGGGTSDYAATQPSDAQLQAEAAFVQSLGSGWSLIYGLSFQQNNPSLAAHQASVLVASLGANRVLFQIGNEPDLYIGSSYTAGTTESNYESQWLLIYNAVIAAVPSARFAGPDVSGSAFAGAIPGAWNTYSPYFTTFLADQGSKLALASMHEYGQATSFPQPSDIKAIWLSKDFDNLPAVAKSIAAAQSLPVRMTEGGSINGNGNTVANALGAALWNLQQMMQLAQAGWAGVEWHGGQGGGYSPQVINADGVTYSAQASFYAMLAFAPLQGGAILPVTTDAPSSMPMMAVKCTDGLVRYLIINKSATAQGKVAINGSGTWSTAKAQFLTGPSLMSMAMTFGDATVGPDGSFNPVSRSLPVASGTATVVVPPSSAAMVTLQ